MSTHRTPFASLVAHLACASLACVTLACAPEQPPETTTCRSVADCALGRVCDVPAGRCIDEPADRFVGSFECTVVEGTISNLERSEVVGRIGDDRWALPSAFCVLTANHAQMLLGFSAPLTGDRFTVTVSAAGAAGGAVEIGPARDAEVDSASMENGDSFTAYGYSASGKVAFSGHIVVGERLTGYLDIQMAPAVAVDAAFGASCPRGKADCGKKTAEVGGVEMCTTLRTGPMCTRKCTANGDCSLGQGVCIDGWCTRRCTADRDCAPLRCVAGSGGQGSGCR